MNIELNMGSASSWALFVLPIDTAGFQHSVEVLKELRDGFNTVVVGIVQGTDPFDIGRVHFINYSLVRSYPYTRHLYGCTAALYNIRERPYVQAYKIGSDFDSVLLLIVEIVVIAGNRVRLRVKKFG